MNILKKVCKLEIILFFIISGLSLCAENTEATTRKIIYSFTLQNKTNKLIKDVKFWAYAPAANTPSQTCKNINTTPKHNLIKGKSGNTILKFSFKDFPPFATKLVRIQADVELFEPSKPKEAIKGFITSEKFIESDSPEIQKMANKLKTPKRFYIWVNGAISNAGYQAKDNGALATLKLKKGDCTDYAYLFTALCRAKKIPARVIGGYICKKDQVLNPANYHNWAEVFYNNKWTLVDPQQKVFNKKYDQYITFKIFANTPGGSTRSPLSGYHRYKVSNDSISVRMNK